jgi:probable HAF family extracellular repeat protein
VYYAWVWKPGVGMKNLGTFGGGTLWPTDINNRGDIAGRAENVLGAGNVAWAWKGNFTNLGGLNGEVGGTGLVRAINGLGVVIGGGYDWTTGESHAFAGDRVPLRDLGTLPNHAYSDARAVNDAGEVVGVSGTRDSDDTTMRAFLVRGAGPMIDLGTLGGTFAQANAINASGQVAGMAEPANGGRQAVLWITR